MLSFHQTFTRILAITLCSSLIASVLYGEPEGPSAPEAGQNDYAISIQTPREPQTPFMNPDEGASRALTLRTGQRIQLSLNTMAFLLQHLEVLNIYNCERWWCSGAPAIYLGLSAINYAVLFREHPVMIPTLITAAVGAGSLLFWDIEYWNIFTRHRTEYYDTHNFYDNALWLNQFWALVYLYLLKPLRQPTTPNHQELTPSEIEQLRLLLQGN